MYRITKEDLLKIKKTCESCLESDVDLCFYINNEHELFITRAYDNTNNKNTIERALPMPAKNIDETINGINILIEDIKDVRRKQKTDLGQECEQWIKSMVELLKTCPWQRSNYKIEFFDK